MKRCSSVLSFPTSLQSPKFLPQTSPSPPAPRPVSPCRLLPQRSRHSILPSSFEQLSY